MLVVELAGRASPVLLLCRDIPNCQDENRSLCASACARVKLLRGFWARGRVRGDRSVFVTSHRPVHSSRALMFQPGSSFCISVQERYFLFAHLPPRCTSMSLIWSLPISLTLIIKVLLLEFEQVFLCELHTPPPLFSGFRGQRSPPQRPVLRRSRNEPCSVTSYGARPSGRAGLPRTSWSISVWDLSSFSE